MVFGDRKGFFTNVASSKSAEIILYEIDCASVNELGPQAYGAWK